MALRVFGPEGSMREMLTSVRCKNEYALSLALGHEPLGPALHSIYTEPQGTPQMRTKGRILLGWRLSVPCPRSIRHFLWTYRHHKSLSCPCEASDWLRREAGRRCFPSWGPCYLGSAEPMPEMRAQDDGKNVRCGSWLPSNSNVRIPSSLETMKR